MSRKRTTKTVLQCQLQGSEKEERNMSKQIQYARLSKIFLDSKNPRLGRASQDRELTQDKVYDRMRDWSLEELATSFLENGFWVHEAVLCTVEEVDGDEHLVAIEGNRRIAALKRLQKTYSGEERSKRWLDLIKGTSEPTDIFTRVPYIAIEKRSDVDTFLGFRHVTGIKEWKPPEKAQFITKLINEYGASYREVMRKIGSKTPVVERNYIAYSIFAQMEETEGLEVDQVKDRFSVLFLSLRSKHVQKFLGVENKFGIKPSQVNPPIDEEHIDRMKEYSVWLFGDDETPPVVKDSRQVDRFARVLASEEGLEYLRAVRRPSLEKAFIIAGGDQEELYGIIATAAYNLQEALSSIHLYKEDEKLIDITKRLIVNVDQIRKTLDID